MDNPEDNKPSKDETPSPDAPKQPKKSNGGRVNLAAAFRAASSVPGEFVKQKIGQQVFQTANALNPLSLLNNMSAQIQPLITLGLQKYNKTTNENSPHSAAGGLGMFGGEDSKAMIAELRMIKARLEYTANLTKESTETITGDQYQLLTRSANTNDDQLSAQQVLLRLTDDPGVIKSIDNMHGTLRLLVDHSKKVGDDQTKVFQAVTEEDAVFVDVVRDIETRESMINKAFEEMASRNPAIDRQFQDGDKTALDFGDEKIRRDLEPAMGDKETKNKKEWSWLSLGISALLLAIVFFQKPILAMIKSIGDFVGYLFNGAFMNDIGKALSKAFDGVLKLLGIRPADDSPSVPSITNRGGSDVGALTPPKDINTPQAPITTTGHDGLKYINKPSPSSGKRWHPEPNNKTSSVMLMEYGVAPKSTSLAEILKDNSASVVNKRREALEQRTSEANAATKKTSQVNINNQPIHQTTVSTQTGSSVQPYRGQSLRADTSRILGNR